jgi:hypothetical protein
VRRTVLLTIVLAALPAAPAAAASTSSTTCAGPVCRTTITEWLGEAPPQAASDDGCPSAATCPRFALLGVRWAPAADGTITIPYVLSPRHPQVPEPDARAAFARMGAVWTAANPRVRFEERPGSDLPGDGPLTGDGQNTFGWGVTTFPGAAAQAEIEYVGGVIREADVVLAINAAWSWRPCEQADGACAGDGGADIGPLGVTYGEIGSVIAHELGHVLGLDHPGVGDETNRELTMHGIVPVQGERRTLQTLALGDVLGIRALYPCEDCAPPRVFVP